MQRDLTTVLCRIGRLSLVLEPRDLWFGVYVAPKAVWSCWWFAGSPWPVSAGWPAGRAAA